VNDDQRPDPSPAGVLKVVVAQASFFAALMFYLGAVYAQQYFGYFHLSPFSLGFGSTEMVLYSLRLLKVQVLIAAVIILMVMGIPWVPHRFDPSVTRRVTTTLQFVLLAAGLALLLLWPLIQPHGWLAPLAIALGLALGQGRAITDGKGQGLRRRAVMLFAAGVCLFWAVTLVARQVGAQDAAADARHVAEWTRVVVLSSNRLSLPSDWAAEEDLDKNQALGLRHRYRYTGLRLLVERGGRYYVVPPNWNAKADEVYVIRESDSTWIGLSPGVQWSGAGTLDRRRAPSADLARTADGVREVLVLKPPGQESLPVSRLQVLEAVARAAGWGVRQVREPSGLRGRNLGWLAGYRFPTATRRAKGGRCWRRSGHRRVCGPGWRQAGWTS
jgi:hypothetical protein